MSGRGMHGLDGDKPGRGLWQPLNAPPKIIEVFHHFGAPTLKVHGPLVNQSHAHLPQET